MELDGASAVVTGGASGLGLAAARRLTADGAQVVVLDLPTSQGEAAAAELGSRATFVPGDVTRTQDVAAAVEAATSRGPLRVAVSCAGVATPGRLVGRDGPLPLEQLLGVVTVNLGGTVNLAAQAAAAMAQTEEVDGERGVIVNTASVAAFEGQVGQIAYAASKAGVVGLTLPAARELAASLIRVVTIAPGVFETPLLAGLPEAARESLEAKTLHPRRLGRAEEFGALVGHIVANPMLNGETIRLDGGIRLEPR